MADALKYCRQIGEVFFTPEVSNQLEEVDSNTSSWDEIEQTSLIFLEPDKVISVIYDILDKKLYTKHKRNPLKQGRITQKYLNKIENKYKKQGEDFEKLYEGALDFMKHPSNKIISQIQKNPDVYVAPQYLPDKKVGQIETNFKDVKKKSQGNKIEFLIPDLTPDKIVKLISEFASGSNFGYFYRYGIIFDLEYKETKEDKPEKFRVSFEIQEAKPKYKQSENNLNLKKGLDFQDGELELTEGVDSKDGRIKSSLNEFNYSKLLIYFENKSKEQNIKNEEYLKNIFAKKINELQILKKSYLKENGKIKNTLEVLEDLKKIDDNRLSLIPISMPKYNIFGNINVFEKKTVLGYVITFLSGSGFLAFVRYVYENRDYLWSLIR